MVRCSSNGVTDGSSAQPEEETKHTFGDFVSKIVVGTVLWSDVALAAHPVQETTQMTLPLERQLAERLSRASNSGGRRCAGGTGEYDEWRFWMDAFLAKADELPLFFERVERKGDGHEQLYQALSVRGQGSLVGLVTSNDELDTRGVRVGEADHRDRRVRLTQLGLGCEDQCPKDQEG